MHSFFILVDMYVSVLRAQAMFSVFGIVGVLLHINLELFHIP